MISILVVFGLEIADNRVDACTYNVESTSSSSAGLYTSKQSHAVHKVAQESASTIDSGAK